MRTALVFPLGPRAEALAGVFGDFRSCNEESAEAVEPVLSFRWRTATSTAVMGTLITENRHGYLEPLQSTTLEITRQVEQGLQWIERRQRWQGEAYVNWQHLNTPDSREIFDYGLRSRPSRGPGSRSAGSSTGSTTVASSTPWARCPTTPCGRPASVCISGSRSA